MNRGAYPYTSFSVQGGEIANKDKNLLPEGYERRDLPNGEVIILQLVTQSKL